MTEPTTGRPEDSGAAEPAVPDLESDAIVAPRPEEEVADADRAEQAQEI